MAVWTILVSTIGMRCAWKLPTCFELLSMLWYLGCIVRPSRASAGHYDLGDGEYVLRLGVGYIVRVAWVCVISDNQIVVRRVSTTLSQMRGSLTGP